MSMVTPMLTQLLKVYASRFVESGSLRAESGDIYGDDLFLDGGAVDRTFCQEWSRWRPGVTGLVHLAHEKATLARRVRNSAPTEVGGSPF